MFVYYVLVVVFILTAAALGQRSADRKYTATVEYLQCEANGRNNTCVYDPPHYPAFALIMYVLLGLFPAIVLVFAVNVREVKVVWNETTKKLSRIFSITSSTIKADTIYYSCLNSFERECNSGYLIVCIRA